MIDARAASSGSASVSTLANVMSACASEAASNTGPKVRHGPHHAAQKSTSTMPSSSMSSSKVLVVAVTVAMDLLGCGVRFTVCNSAGCRTLPR